MSADNQPLPGVLAGIEEVAGREAALRLALALGGQSIHVPRPENITRDHLLVLAAGAAAAAIAARFAGETIYVPKARRFLVKQLTAQGHATREISVRLGISRSAVRRYRK